MNSFSPKKLKDHHSRKKECQLEYFLLDFLFFFLNVLMTGTR